MVEELEREVKAVRKAREALGEKAPPLGRDRERDDGGVLGKRRRDEGSGRRRNHGDESESDIPEDVRAIPMPRDTPPPIPKDVLDEWYRKRRERLAERYGQPAGQGTSANNIALGGNARDLPARSGSASASTPVPPQVEVKTVYESAPVIRDLRKEAVTFVPTNVKLKMQKVKGAGGLVEPEEADELERAGYLPRASSGAQAHASTSTSRHVTMEEVDDEE
jgi:hypothetical protein